MLAKNRLEDRQPTMWTNILVLMVLSYCDYWYHGLNVTSDRWCTLCVLVFAFRKTAVGSSVGTCGERKNGLWCQIEFNLSGSSDTTISS